ncbi:MAG: RHS repeat protein [Bryobacterales bacterium]|nr:RHS repeat protein [Bryobacterales bacterium]
MKASLVARLGRSRAGSTTSVTESGFSYATVQWSFYDDSGNLVYKKDAADLVATMAYDGLSRVTQKSFSGSAAPTVNWCYDGQSWNGSICTGSQANSLGRLTEVRNDVSSTRQTSFDGAGRVTSSQQTTNGAPAYSFQYSYNLAGQRTGVVYPSGRSITTSYDRAGRAATVTGVQGAATNYATGLEYAAHGALSKMTLGNGVVEQWWHSAQRLQPRRVQWGTASVAESVGALEWQYCAAAGYAQECASNDGNVQRQVIRPLAETQSFTYDAVNRVKSATAGWSETYGYDQRGNRVVSGHTGLWSLSSQTPQVLSVYSGGNRVAGWNYDAKGNVQTLGANTGEYDEENRLSKRTHTVTGATTTYSYDGNGRRVMAVDSSPAQTRVFVYMATGEMAAEYGGTAVAGTLYVGVDGLGSTRVVTDRGGGNVTRYDYLPFGEALAAGYGGRTTGSGYEADEMGSAVKVKFTGKERDSETGLNYFGRGITLGRRAGSPARMSSRAES